jgi:hypothetical protein
MTAATAGWRSAPRFVFATADASPFESMTAVLGFEVETSTCPRQPPGAAISLDRAPTSHRVTIVVERLYDGKIRVTSNSWADEGVCSRDQVLEVRNLDSRLHVAREMKRPDEWDQPIAPYDPYARTPTRGPMNSVRAACHPGHDCISY